MHVLAMNYIPLKRYKFVLLKKAKGHQYVSVYASELSVYITVCEGQWELLMYIYIAVLMAVLTT